MNDNTSLESLEAERDCLDKLKDALNEAQKAFDEMIDNDKDKQVSYHWFDIRDRECFEIRAKLVEIINTLEQTKFRSPSGSVKSSHSRRTKSSLSSSSSRSIRLGAAAKTARSCNGYWYHGWKCHLSPKESAYLQKYQENK